jgi:serine/threonine protein kinase
VVLAPVGHDECFRDHLAAYPDEATGALTLCLLRTVHARDRGAASAALLLEESRRLQHVSHPNLVRIDDAGEVDGQRYVALELVEGRDLKSILTRFARHQLRSVSVGHLLSDRVVATMGRRIPVEVTLYFVRELCRGLAHAHGAGVSFGGLAPDDVLASWSGDIKLADIGLGALTGHSWLALPPTLQARLCYLSPEQARGQSGDALSDLWSVGVILWEMLAGRRMVQLPNEREALFARLASPMIPPMLRQDSPLSQGLQRLLGRVLVSDRGMRIDSASALGDALDKELQALAPGFDGNAVALLLRELWGDAGDRERADRQRQLQEGLARQLQAARNTRLPPPPPSPTPAPGTRPGKLQPPSVSAPMVGAPAAVFDPAVTPVRSPRAHKGTRPGPLAMAATATPPHGVTLPGPATIEVGEVVDGRYRVDRLLGEGGMGRVFEVEHLSIGRRLALKVLTPECSSNPELVERFRREARAASLIGHPNIVEVTDSGTTENGCAYFVMERLDGAELSDRVGTGRRLPADRAVALATQIAQALEAAHKVGIIHRDLKPQNVFVVQRGGAEVIKVLDFGIAQVVEPGDLKLTRPGVPMGTPEYMSPEQALGHATDARSDIFSLGAILYEMLTGVTPHHDPSPMGVLIKKSTEAVKPARELAPSVPMWLDRIVNACLMRDPAQRPQSMRELIDALERGIGIGAVAPSELLAAPAANDVVRRRNASAVHWARLLGSVVVVIAIMTVLLMWMAGGR